MWWAGADERAEDFSGRSGVHVDRAGLEAALLPLVDARGVRIVRGRVRDGAPDSSHERSPWRVRAEVEGEPLEVLARVVVDASGRNGVLTRSAVGRSTDMDTTTLALVARFHKEEGWVGAAGHTWIESHADGWVWSLPLGKKVRCVTAMLDQRSTDLTAADLDALLTGELSKAPHLSERLEGSARLGEVWACPASLYRAERFSVDGLFCAGDAGSFIDPLSSYGVKKALSSGWLAGIAAHTHLSDPEMREIATAFFDEREREVYRRYRAASASFFGAASEYYGTPYWAERAGAADAASSPEVGAPLPGDDALDLDAIAESVPQPAVVGAFEALKAAEVYDLTQGPQLEFVERAAVEGYRIVRQRQLASPTASRGMRYVRDVDLLTLVELAPREESVPATWEAYNRVAPPVSLPDFLTAISTAVAAGFLEIAP